MARRLAVVLLTLAGLALAGCQPDTVRLDFRPTVGATYRYRYEVVATITRRVEGEAARVTSVHTSVESTQTVLDETADGTQLEVTLESEGSPARTAVVLVDRAGSLQAIQGADGVPVDAGVPATDLLLGTAATGPPDRPLRVGDVWDVAEGGVRGHGRLDHFAILDGADAAALETELVEVVRDTQARAGSEVARDGELRSSSDVTLDLADGSVRGGRTTSRGELLVVVAPPEGVTAAPVQAVVRYELAVTTTRLG